MEEFETLTKILRKELMTKYRELYHDYSKKQYENENYGDYDDYDDENFEDYYDENYEDFEDEEDDTDNKEDNIDEEDLYDEEVLDKIVRFILNSKYRNIFKLIIFNDVYEYIKSKEISGISLYEYEQEMLEKLENDSLYELLDKIKCSENFFDDLVAVFLEYNQNTLIEQERYKNIKLLELSNNIDKLKKFKVYFFDNLQFQYKKTGKIF